MRQQQCASISVRPPALIRIRNGQRRPIFISDGLCWRTYLLQTESVIDRLHIESVYFAGINVSAAVSKVCWQRCPANKGLLVPSASLCSGYQHDWYWLLAWSIQRRSGTCIQHRPGGDYWSLAGGLVSGIFVRDDWVRYRYHSRVA